MAKKVRGARSSHRPGGMGPSRPRKAADPATIPSPRRGIDLDRAIENVVAEPDELVLEEDAAIVAPTPRKPRRGARVRADSLEARVAAETTWVSEDLRRIAVLSAALLAALLIAWSLLVPLDVIGLY